MPISVDFQDDRRIAIISINGNIPVNELEDVTRHQLVPYVAKHSPNVVHLVWDMRHLDWDLGELLNYLALVKKRRVEHNAPVNIIQHFVGKNAWVQTFRTWLHKNFGETSNFFSSLDDALDYIDNK